jgi:predicted nucleotidyltransferase
MNNMYDKILESFNVLDKDILAVYPYGSRIYGTATEASDYDFVVVLKNLKVESDQLDAADYPITINLYSEESFRDRLAKHRISTLECIFLPSDQILKETKFPFKLDKVKLRESISEKASKDFNQCKKRLSDSQGWNPVTNEPYVRKVYEAKKSLFHCFRIIDFGLQIAKNGKIINYASCNQLWQEILNDPSENWEDYKAKYQETYNNKMTEFRKVAPK